MNPTRTTQAIALVLIAALGVPFVPTVVRAAEGSPSAPPDESKKEDAVAHFTKGVSLMEDQQWDAALAEFLTALAKYPLKNARKNAARCQKQLGRFDEALTGWRTLLSEFADKLKPEETEEAKREITDLEGKVGTLTIRANVDGATVVVDGRERGKTPLAQPLTVPVGTRNVRVTKEGFVPYEEKPVVAGRSNVVLLAKLQPLARAGRLKVVEEGGRALDVVIDGVVSGKTPSWEGVVAPGMHVVLLRSPDGGKLGTPPTTANVVADDTAVLRLNAEELEGEIRLAVQPEGATLILDGVRLGQGAWEGLVRAGAHKVDAQADGYFGGSKSFDAPKGTKVAIQLSLDRDDSSPFWSKGRTYPLSVALFGGGLFGASLGSKYEARCGEAGTECYGRSRPVGFLAGARAAYEIAPRLALELDAGFAWVRMSVARRTSLVGDNGPVPVDIEDTVTLSGPVFGGGASYAFLKRPFGMGIALGAGVMLSRVREARTGTVTTDVAPTARELRMDPIAVISKVTPFLLPELRISYALGDRVDLGLSLGCFIALSDARPAVKGQPVPSAAELPASPQYQGKSIGFVPRGDPESATGTIVLPHAAFFARMSF